MSVTMTGTEVRLGPVDEIPYGEGRAYAVLGRQVAVFRQRTGAVHALSAICPHKGGPLADGQLDDVVVMCPLHANTFELATGCSPSGEKSLTVYPVRVTDDGTIVVTVPPGAEAGAPGGPPSSLAESIPTGAPNPGPRETPLETEGAA